MFEVHISNPQGENTKHPPPALVLVGCMMGLNRVGKPLKNKGIQLLHDKTAMLSPKKERKIKIHKQSVVFHPPTQCCYSLPEALGELKRRKQKTSPKPQTSPHQTGQTDSSLQAGDLMGWVVT